MGSEPPRRRMGAIHDWRHPCPWPRESESAGTKCAPIPLTYLDRDDEPLQWSPDGSLLFVRRAGAWPAAVDRVNTATGDRESWKTIQPADPGGIDAVFRILITPNGKSYCHDYVRLLSELFVVEGLK